MPKMAAYESVVLSTYCASPGQLSISGRNFERAHIEEIANAQQRQDSHVQFAQQSLLRRLVNRLVVGIPLHGLQIHLVNWTVRDRGHNRLDVLFYMFDMTISFAQILCGRGREMGSFVRFSGHNV